MALRSKVESSADPFQDKGLLNESCPMKGIKDDMKRERTRLLLVLQIPDDKFKKTTSKLNVPENASKEQEFVALVGLYGLLKTAQYNGGLGIEYQISEARLPKTPEQVLTPEKDGKLRADCDEIALLFFVSAKRLGIDGVRLLSITVDTKGTLSEEENAKHIAVIVQDANGKFIIMDFTLGFMSKPLDKIGMKVIRETFLGKQMGPTDEIIMSVNAAKIIEGEAAVGAVHYELRGNKYYNKGDYTAAYEEYKKADTVCPTKRRKRLMLETSLKAGEKFYKEKAYAEAEVCFRKALDTGLETMPVQFKLVRALAMQKKGDEALSLCNELIASDQSNELFYKHKTWVAEKLGRVDVEINVLEQWIKINPNSDEAYKRLSAIYKQEKAYDKLRVLCESWVAKKSNDPEAYERLGYAYGEIGLAMREAGKIIEARVYLAKAIKAYEKAFERCSVIRPDYEKLRKRIKNNIFNLKEHLKSTEIDQR